MACTSASPLTVVDAARLARLAYGKDIPEKSATTIMAGDRRFCWAGGGRYSLYRHGPLPGPRTLAGASRLTLHASSRPLRLPEIDHWLAGLDYTYKTRWLAHAIGKSQWMVVGGDGYVRLESAALGEDQLRREITPTADDEQWAGLRAAVAVRIDACLAEREESWKPSSVPPWASSEPDWGTRTT
ncbi:hypothetical protein [Streptomyces cyaneofuscatus]|uniref:hypothetical protein n=1 Tax=Streptomyces cyaneofuscatus TaxID=66883 RepID=UPI0037FABFBA